MNPKPEYEALEQRVAELEQENKVLRERVVRDGKTGLYNTQFYYSNIEDILAKSAKEHQDIGVLFVDIDDLKYLNGNFGHNEGDRIIRDLARILESSTKSPDYVIRWGGDEFILLLSNANGSTGTAVIKRINDKIAKYNEHNAIEGNDKQGNAIRYGLSVTDGYALKEYQGTEPLVDIIGKVSKEMLDKKEKKKNAVNEKVIS